MTWLITKYLLTAGMVVFISEVAKRSDRLGGFIAALPLMTLLTLSWLYIENQPEDKIANHAYYTFWTFSTALQLTRAVTLRCAL